MSKNVLVIFVILFTSTLYGQGKIEVKVINIKEPKGSIRVGLFNTKSDFLKNAVDGKVVKAIGKNVTVIFDNLKPGDYAVSIIHDENDNGELDTNFMGIPKEGFAFGNNALGSFGPPSFDKAKVKVEADLIIQEIRMRYF